MVHLLEDSHSLQGHLDPKDYQLIYKTLYRRPPASPEPNPVKYMHRTKNIDGKIFDEGIPTIVCKQLMMIKDIKILAACHGSDSDNPSFVIFTSSRFKTQSDMDRAVSRINHTHPYRAGFDIDKAGIKRIIITGMNWQGKREDFKFWEGIPDAIKKSVSLQTSKYEEEEKINPTPKKEKQEEKKDDTFDPDVFMQRTDAQRYLKGQEALRGRNKKS
jgi:hypothetical protein